MSLARFFVGSYGLCLAVLLSVAGGAARADKASAEAKQKQVDEASANTQKNIDESVAYRDAARDEYASLVTEYNVKKDGMTAIHRMQVDSYLASSVTSYNAATAEGVSALTASVAALGKSIEGDLLMNQSQWAAAEAKYDQALNLLYQANTDCVSMDEFTSYMEDSNGWANTILDLYP